MPFARQQSSSSSDGENNNGTEYFQDLKHDSIRRESIAADRLSTRLLALDDDDSEGEERILRESLDLSVPLHSRRYSLQKMDLSPEMTDETKQVVAGRFLSICCLSIITFATIAAMFYVGVEFIGPPNLPAGPYQLVERQEGNDFFSFYNFYEGPDSVGSNGYIYYVSEQRARELEIANITMEQDDLDVYYKTGKLDETKKPIPEPFLYLKTAPTEKGPRDSIRLEGKRRYNRGLFIIDVRHMPGGCGVWPAFWMTDEANWPVNGEIDIVEGVNYLGEAKTALHTTKGCDMFDVPQGTMTGIWDTAVGIPDQKTGIPDMTLREARNCFVYDPHQWLNQGCVAIDNGGDNLGIPLNKKGGGVFVLEWDPTYKHIRTWVFSPHTAVPENLVDAIRTAHEPVEENRVMPDPEEWPLPYGYFPVGKNDSGGQRSTLLPLLAHQLVPAMCTLGLYR
eukprot:scaffold5605_cov128-Cylindrotheca_fusiformis.AAC.3